MPAILIFDADNTLWNTDKVFRSAQISLLNHFVRIGQFENAGRELITLRKIDQAIAAKLQVAEYDFRLLATALVYFYLENTSLDEAVAYSFQQGKLKQEWQEIIDTVYKIYIQKMSEIPPLFRYTSRVLMHIHACSRDEFPIVMIILSEGNKSRLNRIITAHGFHDKQIFSEIVVMPKNMEAFLYAQQLGLTHLSGAYRDEILSVAIGDSITRDIRYANRAGLITVLKPSAYKSVVRGTELKEDIPNYRIKNLRELLSVLVQIGLPILPELPKA
jgi:putative hydrolase of the HAD superfamily